MISVNKHEECTWSGKIVRDFDNLVLERRHFCRFQCQLERKLYETDGKH